MKMVAASKMRRAEENASQSRPYAEKLKSIISNLSSGQGITLEWNLESGVSYQVQEAVALTNSPVVWNSISPQMQTNHFYHTRTNSILERYYRISVPHTCP
jgi:hypothetical protein